VNALSSAENSLETVLVSALVSVFRPGHYSLVEFVVSELAKAVATRENSGAVFPKDFGTANGNRTRILALKGPIECGFLLIKQHFLLYIAPRLHL
jgi:hypothetical protein